MAVDITINETIDLVDITVNPNIIEVNVTRTSGGGGSQTLAQTLVNDNQTGGENILVNSADAIELENGSKLSQGIVDAGTGGSKGIALTCAVGFEWKFEAGEAYLTETTSGYINIKHYARSLPTVNDDITKGFVGGSKWYTDNFTYFYECTDPTTGAAVWVQNYGEIPTLDQVLNQGNTGIDKSILLNSSTNIGYASLNYNQLVVADADYGSSLGKQTLVFNSSLTTNSASYGVGSIGFSTSGSTSTGISFVNPTGLNSIVVPDKSGTLATLDDIPSGNYLPLAGGTMDAGADIFFDNGTKISEGEVDAGTGGNKGIALTCAVGYEWKWEAGEAYLTNLSGNQIDAKQYARSVPTPTDDNTKGFYGGSEWFMLTGVRYQCVDATTDDAVWQLVNNTPNLELVLAQGNLNFNYIQVESIPTPNTYTFGLNDRLTYNFVQSGTGGILFLDKTIIFPLTSVIEFRANMGDSDGTTEYTLVPFQFQTDAPVYYKGQLVTDITINPGDVCILKTVVTDGDGSNVWLLDILDKSSGGGGTVTSVGLTMPSAFTVTNSPITSSGDIAVTGAGAVSQYVRGDGTLANFPTSSGGGSSLSFYLNGSVSQGTFGGVAFREMDRTPILGAGTDFTINANGYIQSFITDAGVPNLLEIPAGNWNFETYFSASSGGGSPSFYVELYKWDGATLSLIASNSATPEAITGGTSIDLYVSALAVPQTTLLATDRLAVRIYVTHSGRTITLHTEDNHLCQVITTFSTGLTALNGLTAQVQNLATGTSGTDFGIVSSGSTHTFNLPNASAANRGALTSADWIAFSNRKRQIVNDTTSVTTTGVTVATLIKTYEITTGTLPTSGFLDIFMYLTRSNSTSGGYSLVISVNSVNNFATSTSIAGLTASGNFIQTLPLKAKLVLKSGTVTGAIVSQTTGDNYVNMTSVPTPVTCNNTAGSVWFFVYVTPVSSSQSWTLQGVEITI